MTQFFKNNFRVIRRYWTFLFVHDLQTCKTLYSTNFHKPNRNKNYGLTWIVLVKGIKKYRQKDWSYIREIIVFSKDRISDDIGVLYSVIEHRSSTRCFHKHINIFHPYFYWKEGLVPYIFVWYVYKEEN